VPSRSKAEVGKESPSDEMTDSNTDSFHASLVLSSLLTSWPRCVQVEMAALEAELERVRERAEQQQRQQRRSPPADDGGVLHGAVTAEAMRSPLPVSAGLAADAYYAVLRLLLYIRDFLWGVCRVHHVHFPRWRCLIAIERESQRHPSHGSSFMLIERCSDGVEDLAAEDAIRRIPRGSRYVRLGSRLSASGSRITLAVARVFTR
jgi:hypothetical protein